ncbi:MAG: hypothetical protein H0U23_07245 [Blastocatellia bacterium]|nr:hypothetical protein [Blastocatellia bacterium]
MKVRRSKLLILGLPIMLLGSILLIAGAPAGVAQQPPVKSQEISEIDGEPVLLKHLPDYDRVRTGAALLSDKADLVRLIPTELVLDTLEFPFGTEAATVDYPQGKLLIVEYTNPQVSVEVDAGVQQFLAANPDSRFIYRRIGNYNAFVFGTRDAVAAGELLDQVKYEKMVQWLGDDPYLLKRLERYMLTTSRDVMLTTVFVILGGLGTALLAGIAAGFIFFQIRDQKRVSRAAFSDAGGLTRLNLDGLSE